MWISPPASSESYGYDLKTDYGEIKVADHKLGEVYYTFEKEYEKLDPRGMQFR